MTDIRRLTRRYYDIGLNLSDSMFKGIYNGRVCHSGDVGAVLHRARERGVRCALITGSSLAESVEVKKLARLVEAPALRYTLGVHPCSVTEFLSDPKERLRYLYSLVSDSMNDTNFRAFGEIGLDYDRLHYTPKDQQLLFFEEQLKLACILMEKHNKSIPLFLHMRNCCSDFVAILSKFLSGFHDNKDGYRLSELQDGKIHYKLREDVKFVVHSFTDSIEDMQTLLNLSPNCYIGMNGCSLRYPENIDCCREIPLDRLLLETDAPWCEIRKTHESFKFLEPNPSIYKSVKKDKLDNVKPEEQLQTMIKSRNEPCNMEQVAIVVANVKNLDLDEVANQVWQTSIKIYGE